jgi:3-oxoacyl-[acyl-carrier-protein] synthase II
MTKKIVITGIGATSPLGGTARESWTALLAGESGARSLEQEWVSELQLPVTFAATAKVPTSGVLERHEQKRLDPSSQFALIAGREAWADAGAPEVAPERLAVDWSTGIGGVWTLLDAWDTLR